MCVHTKRLGGGVLLVSRAPLGLADIEQVGPGKNRVTMAAWAVDRVTLLLDKRPMSRQELVDDASRIVQTSDNRLSRYSVDFEDALADHDSEKAVLFVDRVCVAERLADELADHDPVVPAACENATAVAREARDRIDAD